MGDKSQVKGHQINLKATAVERNTLNLKPSNTSSLSLTTNMSNVVDDAFTGRGYSHRSQQMYDQAVAPGGFDYGCSCCSKGDGGLGGLFGSDSFPTILSLGTLGLLVMYILMRQTPPAAAGGRRKRFSDLDNELTSNIIPQHKTILDSVFTDGVPLLQTLTDHSRGDNVTSSLVQQIQNTDISALAKQLETSFNLLSMKLLTKNGFGGLSKSSECPVTLWKCLSQVVEGTIRYLDASQLPRFLFELVLKGGIMRSPEIERMPMVRQARQCVSVFEMCESQPEQFRKSRFARDLISASAAPAAPSAPSAPHRRTHRDAPEPPPAEPEML